jgi:hypothetical protein
MKIDTPEQLKNYVKNQFHSIGFYTISEDNYSVTMQDEKFRKVALEIEPGSFLAFGIWVYIDQKIGGYLLSQIMQCWKNEINRSLHPSLDEQIDFLKFNKESIFSKKTDFMSRYNDFDSFNINEEL